MKQSIDNQSFKIIHSSGKDPLSIENDEIQQIFYHARCLVKFLEYGTWKDKNAASFAKSLEEQFKTKMLERDLVWSQKAGSCDGWESFDPSNIRESKETVCLCEICGYNNFESEYSGICVNCCFNFK